MAQDCVDHMRRAHDIPPLVKVANLARWFPPRIVTTEQWHSMSRPAISGIAVDTLLFSGIGVSLFHLYQVFDRQGTHGALRGSYMQRMHAFLEESDVASLRRRHRQCARDIAARMSRTSPRSGEDKPQGVSLRPKVFRRSISQARGSTKSAAAACSLKGAGTVCSHHTEGDTIQALMKFGGRLEAGSTDSGSFSSRLVFQTVGVYGTPGGWPRWVDAAFRLRSGFGTGSPAAG